MNSKTPLSFCKIDTVKPLIIALSLTMIMGCKSYEPTNELKSIFVEDEIKDLETIRSFLLRISCS